MQDSSVEKLFIEQIKHYSKKDQAIYSPLIPLILQWLKNKRFKKTIKICEFGGGAGQLLSEIRKSYPHAHFTNVEIVNDYKRFLVSKKITFIHGSVLNSDFPNNCFDIIIMRDVLHHLIGLNYQETLGNQELALHELKRLIKPAGAIFIEELTNESEIATRIIYYLSWLNSKIGISIPSLFISPHVIVSFLASKKLLALCKNVFGKQNIKKEIDHLDIKWYFALLHLFSGLTKVTIVANKN